MTKPNPIFIVINYLYAGLIGLGGGIWIYTGDVFGITMGLAAIVCVVTILQRRRWGYFAAAVWCFGLMRLATDEYSGVYAEVWKSAARGLCFVGVVIAIFLHETVAAKNAHSVDADSASDP